MAVGEDRDLLLFPNSARETGLYIIGSPGSGKTKFITSQVISDALSGRGVGVIDVHGDLYRQLLAYLAEFSKRDHSLSERVVLIDPLDEHWTVGINPLEMLAGMERERVAWKLVDATTTVWRVEPTAAPRMVSLLLHTYLCLAEAGLTLLEVPRLLRDTEFRERLVRQSAIPEVRGYFFDEFPKSPASQMEWSGSTLNKIAKFTMDRAISRIVGQLRSTISWRKLLDESKILLVNLSKGELGDESSSLLAAFIVQGIQQAALARSDSQHRPRWYLYLDEFQSYSTQDNLSTILSESRKFGLTLCLAHQYLEQLPDNLRAAVLSTVGTIVCFRVGARDARILAGEIFNLDVDPVREVNWRMNDFFGIPWPQATTTFRPLDAELERLARALVTLKPREFVVRHRGPYRPSKQKSLDIPDVVIDNQVMESIEDLRAKSGQRYGKLIESAESEIGYEREQLIEQLTGIDDRHDERTTFGEKKSNARRS